MNIFKRLMNLFWHDTSVGDLDEPLRSVVVGDASPPAPVIGEPVLSIIEATKDLDRWKFELQVRGFTMLDLKTHEKFHIFPSYEQTGVFKISTHSWLTRDETDALTSAFYRLKCKLYKAEIVNQRERVTSLYCKGEES